MDNYSLADYLIDHGYQPVDLITLPSGHLLIHATINEAPGVFILDSGAGGTVLDAIKTEKFKLNSVLENMTGAGAGGSGLTVYTAANNLVSIGGFHVEDLTIASMNLEHVHEGMRQLGVDQDIDGVLGADILDRGKAVIDYATKRLYLKSPG
jgi:hypothetical protein